MVALIASDYRPYRSPLGYDQATLGTFCIVDSCAYAPLEHMRAFSRSIFSRDNYELMRLVEAALSSKVLTCSSLVVLPSSHLPSSVPQTQCNSRTSSDPYGAERIPLLHSLHSEPIHNHSPIKFRALLVLAKSKSTFSSPGDYGHRH